MAKILFSSLLPLLLLGCNPPFGEGCTCTLMACPEGVKVALGNYPDTARYEGLSVSLAYADTVEAPTQGWSYDRDTLWFSSPKVRKLKPARVSIRIAYRIDGVERTASADRDLAWTSFVCNQCSGSSPSCKDQRDYMAETAVDLEPLP